jgi:hypothetical protein
MVINGDDMGERIKRQTISFEGEILEWLEYKIKKGIFHNFQHGVNYSLLKQIEQEEPRLKHFNIYEDHVTIHDRYLDRLVDVYFRNGKAYCEHCESFDCIHIEFALNIPEVREDLKKRGWTI